MYPCPTRGSHSNLNQARSEGRQEREEGPVLLGQSAAQSAAHVAAPHTAAVFASTVAGGLLVAGGLTVLASQGTPSTVLGGLIVTGMSTVSSGLLVTGASTVSGGLLVTGTVALFFATASAMSMPYLLGQMLGTVGGELHPSSASGEGSAEADTSGARAQLTAIAIELLVIFTLGAKRRRGRFVSSPAAAIIDGEQIV